MFEGWITHDEEMRNIRLGSESGLGCGSSHTFDTYVSSFDNFFEQVVLSPAAAKGAVKDKNVFCNALSKSASVMCARAFR